MNPRIIFSTIIGLASLLFVWQLLSVEPLSLARPPSDIAFLNETAFEEGDVCAPVIQTGVPYAEGIVGAPQFPVPIFSTGNWVDEQIENLVFDSLIQLDYLGRPQPSLAESWVISEQRVIEMTLKKGIKWHDGQPFTSADVLFTVETLKAEGLLGGVVDPWSAVQVKAPDKHTVIFTLDEPYSPFFEALTVGILPQHLLKGIAVDKLHLTSFIQNPIGTGPFKASNSWTDGHLLLKPNLDWWNLSESNLTGIDLRFFSDEATRQSAFEAGELNGINRLPVGQAPSSALVTDMDWYYTASSQHLSLYYNVTDTALSALQSKVVREALTQAIDKSVLANSMNGQAILFEGPFPTNSWAYNPDVPFYEHNPVSATTKLDETLWQYPDDGGTIRVRSYVEDTEDAVDVADTEKEGDPFFLRIIIPVDVTHIRTMAERVQEQWRAVGVDSEIIELTTPALLDTLAQRAYDVALLSISPLHDPDLYDFWSQDAIFFGQNYSGWSNSKGSEALEIGRKTWTIEERLPHYDRFSRQFQNGLPSTPLFQYVEAYGVQNAVNTADITSSTQPRDRYDQFPRWVILDDSSVPAECQ